jgi:ABC-2 type transport system permease protein
MTMTTTTSDPRTRPTPLRASVGRTVRLGLSRGRLELKSFFRIKEAVVFTFAFPIMLLVLFGSIFQGTIEGSDVTYQQILVPGVIAAGIMSVTFSGLAAAVAIERDDGTIARLAGTPMPRGAYFIGKASMAFVCAVAETALMLAVGMVLFGVEPPTDAGRGALFVAIFVLGVAACSLIGIAFASLARTGKSAAAIVNPPFIFLQFISGVWIPAEQLPDPLRVLAALFPLKWMAQGFRSVFLPADFAGAEMTGSWQTPLTIGVLVAWVVAGFSLCLMTFRWTRAD